MWPIPLFSGNVDLDNDDSDSDMPFIGRLFRGDSRSSPSRASRSRSRREIQTSEQKDFVQQEISTPTI